MGYNFRHINTFTWSILLLSFLAASCEKRYWYRKKVREPNTQTIYHFPKTVKVEIQNLSPEFISPAFEQKIKQAGLNELNKQGFVLSRKDTPNYSMVIFLKVDSYYVYGSKTGVSTGGNYHSVLSKKRLGTDYSHALKEKNMVKELTFNYKMISPKNGNLYWESDDGLYFFNEEKKDIRRSVGIVKYALSNVP